MGTQLFYIVSLILAMWQLPLLRCRPAAARVIGNLNRHLPVNLYASALILGGISHSAAL